MTITELQAKNALSVTWKLEIINFGELVCVFCGA